MNRTQSPFVKAISGCSITMTTEQAQAAQSKALDVYKQKLANGEYISNEMVIIKKLLVSDPKHIAGMFSAKSGLYTNKGWTRAARITRISNEINVIANEKTASFISNAPKTLKTDYVDLEEAFNELFPDLSPSQLREIADYLIQQLRGSLMQVFLLDAKY